MQQPLKDGITKKGDNILRSVEDFIKQGDDETRSREYYFACNLFSNANTKSFKIGPVRFEPRTDWLARKTADGVITDITRQRIEKAWQGEEVEELKLSTESYNEQNILDYIWDFPFVCSVDTKGYALRIGAHSALRADS